MIGDIVRVNKDVSIKKGTIVKVRSIDGDRRFQELTGCISCVAVDDIDEMTAGVWLAYIEPIPLTEEILENNGFTKHAYGYSYDMIKLHGNLTENDTVYFTLCICEKYIKVIYVHELQHALRLCGIEKEIVLNPET